MLNNLNHITISGSYRKFPEHVEQDMQHFKDYGVTVLSPQSTQIISAVDGFVSLKGDIGPPIDQVSDSKRPDLMKLIENSHLQAIQQSDALWLTLPLGYCGNATTFEMGWALAHQVPIFYHKQYQPALQEPMVKAYAHPIQSIDYLIKHFATTPRVDPLVAKHFMKNLYSSQKQNTHNATIAVGPIIQDHSTKKYKHNQPRDILLVQTHKWNNKYSIPGGKINHNEQLDHAFQRVIQQQTGLATSIQSDICTFNELPSSGFYKPEQQRVFVDKLAAADSRDVQLDERAQKYIWIPPQKALTDLELEPNARKTIELYAGVNL